MTAVDAPTYLRHTQTGPTNCMATAVACVLNLPAEEVPDFYGYGDGDKQREAVSAWAATRGLVAHHEVVFHPHVPARLCVAQGYTPGFQPHAAVAHGGEVVWDPSPTRAGLALVTDVTWFEEEDR